MRDRYFKIINSGMMKIVMMMMTTKMTIAAMKTTPPTSSPLTMMTAVRRAVLVVMVRKPSMNQVHQMTPLVTPAAFRVSLRRSSFSSTMLFTVMETENTQASTASTGKQRLRVSMNLEAEEAQGQSRLRVSINLEAGRRM